ncbi:nucleoside deaminase [Flavobacteriaceae bacterium]|nr:nucleoside deaminase [Flavobacteriaceae bacterium]
MILNYDSNYFMQKAIDEAKLGLNKGEVPVGAVIVIDNKIIARAHNLTETLCDVTAHAEILAITAASNFLGSKYLHDCTLYVTLEPCPMCLGALYWSQISRIVYSAKDKKNEFNGHQSKIHPKTTIEGGVLANQTEIMLKEFFKSKRS